MNKRNAFTLIELLVVIAIIALLIGILLPSLSKARESAREVVCKAHQRGMAVAMAAYEISNKGFIVGPNTSGSDLQLNPPVYQAGSSTPCQDWDFVSPLLGDSLGFPTDALAKFEAICMTKLRCPSNIVRYTKRFNGPMLPMESKGQQPFTLSYMTPAYFQLYPTGMTVINGRPVESLPANEPISLPRGYMPRTDLIGPFPSKKIFAFEGARYWDPAINGFDYSTGANGTGLVGTPQGNFLSRGNAYKGSGENYARNANGSPTTILRQISLRHGDRMSAAMFDGHVESLNNVQSADPTYYTPSGSRLKTPTQTWYSTVGPANSPLRIPLAIID